MCLFLFRKGHSAWIKQLTILDDKKIDVNLFNVY